MKRSRILRSLLFIILVSCLSVEWSAAAPDPISSLIARGDVDALKEAIEKDPTLVKNDKNNRSLVYYAITNRRAPEDAKRKEMLTLLLAKGADPNYSGPNLTLTPLILAMQNNQADSVATLLTGGADPTWPDLQNNSPFQHLSQNYSKDLATSLINAGPNWATYDGTGGTAFLRLAENPGVDRTVIELALAKGADINVRSRRGYDEYRRRDSLPRGLTALHLAAASGSAETIKALIAHDADLKARNIGGDTPLHRAAQGNASNVAILLEAGADPNLRNWRGDTPLHLLLRQANAKPDGLAPLIAKSDVSLRDSHGLSPLSLALISRSKTARDLILARAPALNTTLRVFDAAAMNDTATLTKLLADQPYLVTVRLANGWTPLHMAAQWAAKDAIGLLVGKGADVNARDAQGGTPLHRLLSQQPLPAGSRDIVALLIEKGADIKTYAGLEPYPYPGNGWKPHNSDTPLDAAIISGDIELVKLLLDKGASLTGRSEHMDTPLLVAIKTGQSTEMAKLLIDRGSDINAGDEVGMTPLTRALWSGNPDIAKYLVAKGADVNLTGPGDDTPLMRAVRANNLEIVTLLLDKGADLKPRSTFGESALSLARRSEDIKTLLLARGAAADLAERVAAPRNVEYPVLVAAQKGDLDKLNELLKDPAVIKVTDEGGETALHKVFGNFSANFDKLLPTVQLLLDKGADPNARNRLGQTPLFNAARSATKTNIAALTLLLEKGADAKMVDKRGTNPLFWVNAPEAATLLIAKGADPSIPSLRDGTPLHAKATYSDVVDALLAGGADPNRRNGQGDLPLHIALRSQGASPLLIEKSDLRMPDSFGLTPLQTALRLGLRDQHDLILKRNPALDDATAAFDAAALDDVARLRQMIEAKPQLAVARLADGGTPLHIAARWMAKNAMTLLLSKGADPNARDGRQNTVLSTLLQNYQESRRQATLELATLLIEKGAEINTADGSNNLPVFRALASNNKELLTFLLDKGADPNLSPNDETLLHMTVTNSNIRESGRELADLLLAKGAAINALGGRSMGSYNPGGFTPLALAIAHTGFNRDRALVMARYFVEKGADVKVVDDAGNAPLAIAVLWGQKELVTLLLDKGADVNARNFLGQTPLALALKKKQAEMADLLRQRGAKEPDPTKPARSIRD